MTNAEQTKRWHLCRELWGWCRSVDADDVELSEEVHSVATLGNKHPDGWPVAIKDGGCDLIHAEIGERRCLVCHVNPRWKMAGSGVCLPCLNKQRDRVQHELQALEDTRNGLSHVQTRYKNR